MASKLIWNDRTLAAYRNFPYAPPHYPGAPYRARLPQPPYEGAEEWKCSVYYYWWEYLRRHEGFRETCLSGGKGEYQLAYKWFGDVHNTDFHEWWSSHFHLFTFVSETQNIATSEKFFLESDGVFLHVGYSRSKSEMIASAREQIMKIPNTEIKKELQKTIRLRPYSRPVLKSLHQHLQVWDNKIQYPDLNESKIADLARIDVSLPYSESEISQLESESLNVEDLKKSNRRAKRLAVQRHLRIARQYIDNVIDGEFPKRETR